MSTEGIFAAGIILVCMFGAMLAVWLLVAGWREERGRQQIIGGWRHWLRRS
jgi:hypothetical protein